MIALLYITIGIALGVGALWTTTRRAVRLCRRLQIERDAAWRASETVYGLALWTHCEARYRTAKTVDTPVEWPAELEEKR